MKRTCDDCGKLYDDAERNTICPHPLIMPRKDLDQKILALTLIDKPLRFNHMPDDSEPLYIQFIFWNGMVEIRGMAGEFAPHLFTVKEKS